jgi:hypothetical protein
MIIMSTSAIQKQKLENRVATATHVKKPACLETGVSGVTVAACSARGRRWQRRRVAGVGGSHSCDTWVSSEFF